LDASALGGNWRGFYLRHESKPNTADFESTARATTPAIRYHNPQLASKQKSRLLNLSSGLSRFGTPKFLAWPKLTTG
jgi:hypothetical protein